MVSGRFSERQSQERIVDLRLFHMCYPLPPKHDPFSGSHTQTQKGRKQKIGTAFSMGLLKCQLVVFLFGVNILIFTHKLALLVNY